ncbi:MAG: prefoldin subunit alpha [Candidatus Pacearchaeota archaeon]
MENKENREKEIIEFNFLDMQLRQLEQQAMLLEQQIVEQQKIILNLDELKKAKKGQNVLFPLSKDIFIEGKIENPEEVFVNIGSKTIAKKSIEEAKLIEENQIKKLIEINEEIKAEIEKILLRITKLEKKLNG